MGERRDRERRLRELGGDAMRRGLVFVMAALVVLMTASRVEAFHAQQTFIDGPEDGGAGRIFYLGVPLERGWDCTACHIDPARRIGLEIASVDPPELLSEFRYLPEQTYALEIVMNGEHRGRSAGATNFNSFGVTVIGADGLGVGSFGGLLPSDLEEASKTVLSVGIEAGRASWTFTWTAPPAGTGTVTMYVAAVDGDGNDDPFGDDTYTATLRLDEAGGATAQRVGPRKRRPARWDRLSDGRPIRSAGWTQPRAYGALAALLMALGVVLRRLGDET